MTWECILFFLHHWATSFGLWKKQSISILLTVSSEIIILSHSIPTSNFTVTMDIESESRRRNDGGDAMSECEPMDLGESSAEAVSEDCQECESFPYALPLGAALIIRQLAAEEIFLQIAVETYNLPDEEKTKKKRHYLLNELRYLIHQFPGICHRKYEFFLDKEEKRELYPLALVCCLLPTIDLLDAAYEANPRALHVKESEKGSQPLHYSCSFRSALPVVQYLLSKHPSGIKEPRNDGMLPLHLAVYFRSPDDVTNFILEAWPSGSRCLDDGLWSPLHAAASGRANLRIVQLLYNLYPTSILTLDNKGRTPLHLSCWHKGNDEVVAFLLRHHPQALHMEDSRFETCLFRAARSQSASVLQLFLALGDPPLDDLGATILHFAILDNTTDVVQYLIDRYPIMITTQTADRDRYLPLHTASHFDAPLNNVRLLVQANPQTLFIPNGHGKLPLELAQSHGAKDDLVAYLQEMTSRYRGTVIEEVEESS